MDMRVLQQLWMLLACCMAEEWTRQQLISGLLTPSRYDGYTIPELNEDYPTNVTVQISIADVHSVSETSMEYSVDMILRQWWRDFRLDYSSFNTTIDKVELDPRQTKDVWKPDTFFTNEKKASIHGVTATNTLMHIYENGTVLSTMRLAMTLSCEMILQMYPFDVQQCSLVLQSFAYTSDNIDLNWLTEGPVILDQTELPQFQMSQEVEIADYDMRYPQTGFFSTLRADIFLRRKSGFYFLQVFIPSILLVTLSWVSFWVDPHAVPARVSLGVTCVLTMTTQSSGTRQTLPPVSYVKAIDVWMFVCLLFVFAALLEFAYVNVLLRRHRLKEQAEAENTAHNRRKKLKGRTPAARVDFISRFAFPGSFAIFLGVFALVCAFAGKPDYNGS